MPILVQKFGGSSVATSDKIRRAAQRAIDAQRKGNQVVVVASARGHQTDELIANAMEIDPNPPKREMDMLLSTGEQQTVSLLAMACHAMGQKAISFTGFQISMITDDAHTKARIRSIGTERIRKKLDEGYIVISEQVSKNSGYLTKGDNNVRSDQGSYLSRAELGVIQPVKPEWIVGKAFFAIPLIGYIPLNIKLVAVILILVLVGWEFYQRRKSGESGKKQEKKCSV